MIITVSYHAGWISIVPDPAVVRLGETVEWWFKSPDNEVRRIRWAVYFEHGSPFQESLNPLSVESEISLGPPSSPPSAHSARLTPFVTDQVGDYKYGVRVEDSGKQEMLADDDPRLLVLK